MLKSRFWNSSIVTSKNLQLAKSTAISDIQTALGQLSQTNEYQVDLQSISDTTIYKNDDASVMGFNPMFQEWNASNTMPNGYSGPYDVAMINSAFGGLKVKKKLHFAKNAPSTTIFRTYTFAQPLLAGTLAVCSWHVAAKRPDLVTPLVDYGYPSMTVRLQHSNDGMIFSESVSLACFDYVNTVPTFIESTLEVPQQIHFLARADAGKESLPIFGITVIFERGHGGVSKTLEVAIESFAMALADSSFDNKTITLKADGTLSGANGQVTITGLGFKGDLSANKAITHRGLIGQFGPTLPTLPPTNPTDCFAIITSTDNMTLLHKSVYIYKDDHWMLCPKGLFDFTSIEFFNVVDNLLYKPTIVPLATYHAAIPATATTPLIPEVLAHPQYFGMFQVTDLSLVLTDGEKFVDQVNDKEFIWDYATQKLILSSTIGSPDGTYVGGVLAEEIAKGYQDFKTGNNSDSTPIAELITSFAVISALDNKNGTFDVTFQWAFTENPLHGIDGFFIEKHTGATDAVYAFPDSTASGLSVDSTRRKCVYTITSDQFVSAKIYAYRMVNSTVNAGKTLRSAFLISASYQPAPLITFDGTDINYALNTILSDQIISAGKEKLELSRRYDDVVRRYAIQVRNQSGDSTVIPPLIGIPDLNLTPMNNAKIQLAAALFTTSYPEAVANNGTAIYESRLLNGLTRKILTSQAVVNSDSNTVSHYISNIATFKQKFIDFDIAEATITTDLRGNIGNVPVATILSEITTTKYNIEAITKDNTITPTEKKILKSFYDGFMSDKSILLAEADLLAINTTSFSTACVDVNNLLTVQTYYISIRGNQGPTVSILLGDDTTEYYVSSGLVYTDGPTESAYNKTSLFRYTTRAQFNAVIATYIAQKALIIAAIKRETSKRIPEDAVIYGLTNVPVQTVIDTITDVLAANNTNVKAIVKPAFAVTPITHSNNTNLSSDLTISWTWAGVEKDIDGFMLFYKSWDATATRPANTNTDLDARAVIGSSNRSFVLRGQVPNRKYSFGIAAFRVVNTKVYDAATLNDKFVVTPPTLVNKLIPWTVADYQPNLDLKYTGNISNTATITDDVTTISFDNVMKTMVNFSTGNDALTTLIVQPAVPTFDFTSTSSGKGMLTVSWAWTGVEANIDGFVLGLVTSVKSKAHPEGLITLPTKFDKSFKPLKYLEPDARSFTFLDQVADTKYYAVVRAYRIVNTNAGKTTLVSGNTKWDTNNLVGAYAISALYQAVTSTIASNIRFISTTSPHLNVKVFLSVGDSWENTGVTQTILSTNIPAGSSSVWDGAKWIVASPVLYSGIGVPGTIALQKNGDRYVDTTVPAGTTLIVTPVYQRENDAWTKIQNRATTGATTLANTVGTNGDTHMKIG